MKTLCLHPVRGVFNETDSEELLLKISSDDCRDDPLALYLTEEGALCALPEEKVQKKGGEMALLRFHESAGGNAEWLLSPASETFLHEGIRPLPVAILEPGDVLAYGDRSWLTSELWRPEPFPAPDAVAEKECSVCAGALNLAPVIQCPCGRYYHLEKPDGLDNPEALNCYVSSGMCGLCQRKPSLSPQFLPQPPEEMLPWENLESALAGI